MKPAFGTVAVAGASMAGLLAAWVLAAHAREVLLIERDAVRDQPPLPRKGVPQGRHAHALLASGQRVLEGMFPGLTEELAEAGAAVGGGAFFTAGGYLEADARQGSLYASRGLLEAEVRLRVLALPNVTLHENCQAEPPQLVRGRVEGMRITRLDGGGTAEYCCELVVDASGRGSRMPAWLTACGYAAPPIQRVEVGMRYATRHFRRTPGELGGRSFLSVSPTPALPRACGVLAQEGERWIVTLIGYFGDQPPADDAGFLAFARSLPASDAAVLIEGAEPLDAIHTYAFPANVRVSYGRMARRPAGLLVIGDALASFSPVYGQGMSVAALEAQALKCCLEAGIKGLEERYFNAAAGVIEAPWTITVGNDRQLAPGGPHGSMPQRLRWRWVQHVLRAGHRDRHIADAFLRVARLLDPPTALLRPALVARVIAVAGVMRT
ncbi:NAD(P)/FAD-dependent oxidoreductase [Variovorax sp. J22R115]|uniref:FAD-dependent oxidoreductase n=1 Tax=Variovorax sp. J22R115 TaxID=3053509 RepID=UPI002577B981|nr:monooxygenase [Variovorax sp. J22R115]MDM0047528.1 monooxygenase [Variovorax sp. J22R115]